MNLFIKAYCRAFQTVFRLALPILPYRDPEILPRIDDIPSLLKEQGRHRPLIVTDRGIHRLGLTRGLEDALKESGLEYSLFDEVVANPTTENVGHALSQYRLDGCDCLIAFGGGSPMDCAKGVGALTARPHRTLNDLKGILKVRRRIPLLIAIPTTAGTGSETTLACVVVDSKTRHKYAINDFPLIPAYAVLDETVTMTLPPAVVAETGMDALTHAVEAYIGRSGNRSTREDALEASRLILENLDISYREASPEARKNMLLAAHRAGRAFSKAYVGYVHALAHALGGKYDTPHGLANAVILPIVLREYGSGAHRRLAELARYCRLAGEDVSDAQCAQIFIDKIEAMNAGFGIPAHLPVIRDADIPELADHAYREANPLYPVPVLWDRRKLAEMYRRISG